MVQQEMSVSVRMERQSPRCDNTTGLSRMTFPKREASKLVAAAAPASQHTYRATVHIDYVIHTAVNCACTALTWMDEKEEASA